MESPIKYSRMTYIQIPPKSAPSNSRWDRSRSSYLLKASYRRPAEVWVADCPGWPGYPVVANRENWSYWSPDHRDCAALRFHSWLNRAGKGFCNRRRSLGWYHHTALGRCYETTDNGMTSLFGEWCHRFQGNSHLLLPRGLQPLFPRSCNSDTPWTARRSTASATTPTSWNHRISTPRFFNFLRCILMRLDLDPSCVFI